jgi:hypothetical protein
MIEYHVFQVGGGIPSTTLHLMYYCEEITTPPEMDGVIFADAGAESKPLYDHVDLLHSFCGPDNYTAKRGNLGRDLLADPKLLESLSAHTPDAPAAPCRLTKEYKLEPVIHEIREIIGLRGRQRFPHRQVSVILYLAVTYDERHRAELIRQRLAEYRWLKPVFPLIERKMTLWHCRVWMRGYGNLPLPLPRSACVFCPFRCNKDWKWLRQRDPAGFALAVEIDLKLRESDNQAVPPRYLHHSCVPLCKANLDAPESRERRRHLGFRRECEGMCGL